MRRLGWARLTCVKHVPRTTGDTDANNVAVPKGAMLNSDEIMRLSLGTHDDKKKNISREYT